MQLVEEAGSETYLHLDAGGHAIVARVAPDVASRRGRASSASRRRRDDVYLFDADTGEAAPLMRGR